MHGLNRECGPVAQSGQVDRVQIGEVVVEKLDTRPEAAESRTREIEHRGREIHPDKVRIGQRVEHVFRNKARTDSEIKDSPAIDLCAREQGQKQLLLLLARRKLTGSSRVPLNGRLLPLPQGHQTTINEEFRNRSMATSAPM